MSQNKKKNYITTNFIKYHNIINNLKLSYHLKNLKKIGPNLLERINKPPV